MNKKIITICFCLAVSIIFIGCKDKEEGRQSTRTVDFGPEEVVQEADANAVEDVNAVDDVNEPSVSDANEVDRRREGRAGFGRGSMGRRSGERRTLSPEQLASMRERFPDFDPNDPNSIRGMMGRRGRPGARTGRITDANGVVDANAVDPNALEIVNLKSVEVSSLIKKIAEWVKPKAIIPTNEEILKKRISVYSSVRVPRKEALMLVYAALKANGIVATEENGIIFLKPIEDVKLGAIPTVSSEQLLAEIEDKSKIVQKFFKLESYLASQMMQVIQPLIGEHGFVTSDDNSNQLMIIDSVGNLIRIEKIIEQLDISETGQETVTEIFEIKYGDPAEIVRLLNQLLGTESTTGLRSSRSSRDSGRFRGMDFRGGRSSPPQSSSQQAKPATSKTSGKGMVASVSIEATKGPVILIPELKRRWIIARASTEDMEKIRLWIEKLDVEKDEKAESQWETYPLEYGNAIEVEDAVDDILNEMPDELRPNVYVEPLEKAKQLIIFGSKENREIIKELIKEIDVLPPPDRIYPEEIIILDYLDPDETIEKLKELYQVTAVSGLARGFSPFGRGRGSQPAEEEITVVSLPSQNAITVRAQSQELLNQIVARVKQWDQPINFKDAEPRIIELSNTDPVKITEMLNEIFGGEQGVSGQSIMRLIYGSDSTQKINKLYGKVTFTPVPDVKKILVICSIPELYDEIIGFVKKLDKAKPPEMPKAFVLKYANPWDIAELLNAMFNEPGTTASIQRPIEGLGYGITTQSDEGTGGPNQQQQTSSQTTFTPWWSGSGARSAIQNELPISNAIGKIRFLPDSRSKSVLVLAPLELLNGIEELIQSLDKPGKQVLIEVIVVEVNKSKLDSVGLQVSSDPTSFNLSENSLRALGQFTGQESHGSMVFGAGGTSGSLLSLNSGLDLYVFLDFLVKKTNAKIINRQQLWATDYKDAEFFKGQEIAFLGDSTVSGAAGAVTQSLVYKEVGITLRVKPNITPEDYVNMEIDLAISQVSQEVVNTQPIQDKARAINTVRVKNGQTILLASILSRGNEIIQRKIPLLGDIPLIGGLFRHQDSLTSDSELLVFITPRVVNDEGSPEEMLEIKEAIGKKESVEEHLDKISEWLEEIE